VWSHLRQATTTAGAAALAADARKSDHSGGASCPCLWSALVELVCTPLSFLHELSWHAAHVRGGAQADVKRRRGYIEAQLRGELSVVLAKANAERLVNLVTGVAQHRVLISSVSTLLIYHH